MERKIFIDNLSAKYTKHNVRISKHGERLLINGHVIKGIVIDDLFFKKFSVIDEKFIHSCVERHIEKYGDIQGEYYGEDSK